MAAIFRGSRPPTRFVIDCQQLADAPSPLCQRLTAWLTPTLLYQQCLQLADPPPRLSEFASLWQSPPWATVIWLAKKISKYV